MVLLLRLATCNMPASCCCCMCYQHLDNQSQTHAFDVLQASQTSTFKANQLPNTPSAA
jgi:hypothetical protein